jgi:hypothetical protein
MATLKTNTLTGTSTAGSIAVTGEGNSTTTNLQQGLIKTWICTGDTASSGNPAVYDSFNHGSITDNGTGDTSYAYTNNMATAKGYAISGVTAHSADVTAFVKSAQPKEDDSMATGTCRIVQVYAGASSAGVADEDYVANMMAGDLA